MMTKEKIKETERIRTANMSTKTGKVTGYFEGNTPQRAK